MDQPYQSQSKCEERWSWKRMNGKRMGCNETSFFLFLGFHVTDLVLQRWDDLRRYYCYYLDWSGWQRVGLGRLIYSPVQLELGCVFWDLFFFSSLSHLVSEIVSAFSFSFSALLISLHGAYLYIYELLLALYQEREWIIAIQTIGLFRNRFHNTGFQNS